MTIRPQDVLLYSGGECLQRFGVPFWRMTRSQDVAAVNTRASDGAFVGKDGILRYASDDRVRTAWYDLDGDGLRERLGIVPTGEVENVILQSEDFNTTWTLNNAPVTTDDAVAPDGTTTADRIDDNSASVAGHALQTVTIADDGTSWTISVYVHKTAHSGDIFRLTLTMTGGTTVAVVIQGDPDTGAIHEDSTNTPDDSGVEDFNDDYWRYWVTVANNASGNTTLEFKFHPSIATTVTGSIDTSLTGHQTIWGAQAVNRSLPGPYVPTTTAAATHQGDSLRVPFPHAVQRMTGYISMLEQGSGLDDALDGDVLHLGGIVGADPRLHVEHGFSQTAGQYSLLFDNGTQVVQASIGSNPSSFGDLVELFFQVDSGADGAGDLLLEQSVGGNAAVQATQTGPTGGIASPPVPFAEQGSTGAAAAKLGPSGGGGYNPVFAVKLVAGLHDWTPMRNLFAYDSLRAVA